MADLKCLVFFRIDHPEIKKKVDGLGKVVSFEEVGEIDSLGLTELSLDYLPSCPCMEGSPKAIELEADERYVSRELKYN